MIIHREINIVGKEDQLIFVSLIIPQEFRKMKGITFIFSLSHKERKIQEISQRVKGAEMELTFSVDSEIARRPASLRITVKAIKRKF